MVRSFRYPLHPTTAQEVVLRLWLGQCCDLYNGALQERRELWRRSRGRIKKYDHHKSLTEWRGSDPEARAVPALVQRSALDRADQAFQVFYKRCDQAEKKRKGGKKAEDPGFPRFRPKRRYDSFSVSGSKIHLNGKRLSLPKLPDLKVHLYRPLQGKVLLVTVHREPDGKWNVSFACDVGAAPEKVVPVTMVGIDVGLKSLVTTSDGEVFENIRARERAAVRLARAQRVQARRKKGSRSRERARIQVARAHRHVANQRRDHARKIATSLVSRYDVIAHEDLSIRAMGRGILSKSIHDVGWGILFNALACKAESAGKHVVRVDPHGTSQRCSRCGETVPKDLNVRIHDCPHCGLRIDRDHNAAINICALGRSAVTELVSPPT